MDFFNQLFNKPSIEQLDPTQVQAKMKQSPRPFLLDVRTPTEYKTAHISGAELIPLEEVSSKINRIPKGREIICVCASGSRSVVAVRQLTSLGYQVSNLKGGMYHWMQAGLPVKKGDDK
jgi:rhodanese-related sulfurtransferase